MIPTLHDISNLKGKRVLLRIDLNIPIDNGKLIDDFRLKKSLRTLNYLRKQGAKIIGMSHIGRSKDDSLRLISKYLQNKFKHTFLIDLYSEDSKRRCNEMREGDMVLFENLRRYEGEESNDDIFASYLATFGDIYVNEAFSVSHRNHSSIVALAKKLPSYAGFQFMLEIEGLSKAFHPEHPFLLIIGGAKFKTKLPIVQKFLSNADTIFLGGALSNDIYKYKGFEVGTSLISDVDDEIIKNIYDSGKVLVPGDVTVLGNEKKEIKDASHIGENDMIVDCGKKTLKELKKLVKNSSFIVWNGPLGLYEKGFEENTMYLAKMIAKSKAYTIVGGGDTLSVINKKGLNDRYDFVSTAGGAMLSFLEKETLPGIEALK